MPRKKAQPPSPDSPSAVKQRHDEAIANGDPFAFIDALQDLPGPLLNWTNEFRHLRQIIRHRNQSDPRKFAEEVLSNGIGTLADFALRIGFYARCQMAKVDSAFRGHSQDSLPPGVGGLITKLTEIYSQLSVLLERQACVARMWALADAKNAEMVLQRRNGLHRRKRSRRATGQTDPFALQLKYDPSLLSQPEAIAAGQGHIHLDWLDETGTPEWRNAVDGNYNLGTQVFTNVPSSWDTFASAHSITDSNLVTFLGSWGVDTTNHVAWAVIDHNSEFAVTPEPGAYAATRSP